MTTDKRFSIQDIENNGADRTFGGFPMREMVGFDGTNLQRMNASNMSVKVTTSGTNTYLALAKPGASQSSAIWQARRIDSSSGVSITWADGNANFDNSATDLTALSYS